MVLSIVREKLEKPMGLSIWQVIIGKSIAEFYNAINYKIIDSKSKEPGRILWNKISIDS